MDVTQGLPVTIYLSYNYIDLELATFLLLNTTFSWEVIYWTDHMRVIVEWKKQKERLAELPDLL